MNLKRLLILILGIMTLTVQAQDKVLSPSTVGTGTFIGISEPLKDIPELTADEMATLKAKAELKLLNPKLRYRSFPFAATALPKGPDEVWQKEPGNNRAAASDPNVIFEGQGSPYFPPDCNGTAGPDHYMQTVNTTYAIYDKAGTKLAGPTNMNLIFGSVPGSNCNDGDPIILYDEEADRWMAAEFSLCGSQDRMLIAVSTTNDPTGTWYQYSFVMNGMPDYEKFGIWNDGYYMSTNTSSGTDIYVFERSVMIAGGTDPKMVSFDNQWRPTSIDGFMMVPPLDCDGPAAPADEPGMFIAFNDDAIGGGTDQLWLYELDVDWATTTNSTFTRVQQLDVAPFDVNFGNNWNNIKQPNTSQELDGIPQVIMNVPQYRNFGSYQSIVCCHTVDVDGTDHAGVRWYELRKTSGDWTVRQQGTYAPDGNSRWMGSVMMNGSHELALGYSISSTSVYPGIRYTGQTEEQYNAASGIMDVPEGIIHEGAAAQSGANRWGDYSLMSVDPSNDETFWYTNQYVSGGQKTKVSSFNIGPLGPAANYVVDNNRPCLNETTTLTDLTTGSPISWSWSFTPATVTFVNGTSNTSQNPQVQFNAYGTYDVSLNVSSAVGSDILTMPAFITVNQVNADFIASNTNVVVNNPTIFTDASTCDVTSWLWNFGADATPATATTQGPHSVVYSTTGPKTITLTLNGSVTETKTDYINVMDDFFIMTSQTIETCSGTFTDPGGNYNYGNNLNYTSVILPSQPGNQISVNFTQFDLESSTGCTNDKLVVYNGRSAFAPIIGTYCGTDSPGLITADNQFGALTFVFRSNASNNAQGWNADVACISMVTNPLTLNAVVFTDTRIDLDWELNPDANNVMLLWSPDGTFGTPVSGTTYEPGSVVAGGGTVIYSGNGTYFSHTSLTAATTYYYKAFSVSADNQYSSGITAMAVTMAEPPTLSVTPLTQSVTALAGNSSFNIVSNTNWNAVSDADWCTVTVSGNGVGVINATYTENMVTTSRTANITVTVNGLEPVVLTLIQAGAEPVLAVDPLTIDVDTPAGSADITISSNASWTAQSNAAWCTVTSAGTGNGIAQVLFEQNDWAAARVADITITVSGLDPVVVTLTQAAALAHLSIDPQLAEVTAQSGAADFTINANFDWTASTDAPWLTIPQNGSGNLLINATYSENQSLVSRSATITITGNDLVVLASLIQAAGEPMIYVSPENINVPYLAGSTSLTVTSNTDWTASADSAWITLTPSGNGNGSITVDYIENPYYADRTSTISVAVTGKEPVAVTMTQNSSELALPENEIDGLRIYPNPASDQFVIEANSLLYPVMEVLLKNPAGETVMTKTCSGKDKYIFNTHDLSSGTYMIHIDSKDHSITRKIVIVK